MRIHILAVGNRMPDWVDAGYREYEKRLPVDCPLQLVEIAPAKRSKGMDIARARRQEAERLLASIPKGARVVALEVGGKEWSTEQLAANLETWMREGRDLALLVGGPDGLAEECRQQAEVQWSLSRLTLPHPLVRVLLAEQLYRACSVIKGHPYHR